MSVGDKGVKGDDPRRELSVRGRRKYDGDRPPVMNLVRRLDGVMEFVVMNDMEKAVHEISSIASGDCIVITD
ncbi:hypothetical protein HRbin02_00777 [Candidatus Calditenuaceae archaeon HR02]|nr:hypothetical protein HRbin02_00777 [Candidatus Calditenuaceae archaeon HR02]